MGAPIDSTPSVVRGGSTDRVLVGVGNAFEPHAGGYVEIGGSGGVVWSSAVPDPPQDFAPALGVQASITVASLQGQLSGFAGALGQESAALSASTGHVVRGWPFFTADTTFSTAAAADLYGNGRTELVVGGASTAGFAMGQNYPQGGHIRVLNENGGLICHYDTDQEVDSSPAVGPFLAGHSAGIVIGTGSFYSNAVDTDRLIGLDSRCRPRWSDRLDGVTSSSPALADILGNGQLQVAEGTDNGSTGSVWVINPANGAVVWHEQVPGGRVIGSVVTADLFGTGYQDLIVPTTFGTDIIDGRTGRVDTTLTSDGYQNAPLVTVDPNGEAGITLAGYDGNNEAVITHYEINGSNGAAALAGGSWPMFHHDPRLTGLQSVSPLAAPARCAVPAAAWSGYETVASDGGLFSFGQSFCGSTGGIRLARPVVGAADAPSLGGYWLVASDGGVFSFGGAAFHGSTGGIKLAKPIVGMAATPNGGGYWLVASDGGIFTFGNANYYGSAAGARLSAPVVGMAATADGKGYWLTTAKGDVYAFGDAIWLGSTSRVRLAHPVVAIAEDRATGGYWLVASDGGVFAFNAPFLGSTGALRLSRPIVGLDATEDGHGYWLVGSDGGIFSYGDAAFHGSTGAMRLNRPVIAMLGLAG